MTRRTDPGCTASGPATLRALRLFLLLACLAGTALAPAPVLAQAAPAPGGGAADRGGDERLRSARQDRAPAGVARTRGGRVEYVLTGPPAAVGAAAAALTAAGAGALRDRPLPALGRRTIVLVLPPGLGLGAARQVVAGVSAEARLDFHARYGFAQGAQPRLYAPDLVALPAGCRLRGRVTVGLIDGPVAADHPALAGVRLRRESVLLDGEVAPDADHGTAVAALIGGAEGAGPLRGFAAGVSLHAISAFTVERGREGADVDRIGAGLDRLLAAGVRIVNLSFAGPPNTALADLLEAAAGRGAILIAASGNEGGQAALLPGAAPGVIAVTAVDARGRAWRRATGGGHVEFAAPGVDLIAASATGAGYVTGTSYAAPIVTAFAARLAAGGAGSTDAVRRGLARGAADLGAPGRDARFGWGLVRAPGC